MFKDDECYYANKYCKDMYKDSYVNIRRPEIGRCGICYEEDKELHYL